MLETTSPAERTLPVVSPEAAGLVVEYLEGSHADFINSIDAPGDTECHAIAQIDLYSFRPSQWFTFVI